MVLTCLQHDDVARLEVVERRLQVVELRAARPVRRVASRSAFCSDDELVCQSSRLGEFLDLAADRVEHARRALVRPT
ncbi:MAG: hypothetical protein WKF73_19390 [Nocardioidaceae bacterium]